MNNTITRIEREKGKQATFAIFVNDEFALNVSEDILVSFQLKKGMNWDDISLKVEESESSSKCFGSLLNYLARRMYSEFELRTRLLEKDFLNKQIDEAIEKAKAYKYINDNEFGEMFVREKQKLNKWGKEKIRFELKQKGVSFFDEWIDLNLEIENADFHFEKKIKQIKGKTEIEKINKVKRFLIGKGFSVDCIQTVVNRHFL